MSNGYTLETLTSVDMQEIDKIGGKVIENYGEVIYRENLKKSPFREDIKKTVCFEQKV